MARPTKFTPEVTETILKAIGMGATYKDAAEAAGVEYVTFQNWMNKGKDATSGKFLTFFNAVRREEAAARLRYLSTIAEASRKGDWRAALEYLKRRDRPNWGDGVDITSGNEKITEIGVKLIDYRNGIAPSENGSSADSETPSENESPGDG